MNANKVKVTWQDEDGSIDYEILDLSDSDDVFNVISVEAFYKEGD